MKPLAIDLFCGLGGWTDGLLAEGYYVVGFDIERHDYGTGGYPAQLVLQSVLTLHGSQFKDAALIVASPPCQEYSYMAMPWSRAKAIAKEYRSSVRDVADLTRLFDACFRIQREASEAAGHHIPMVVENVRGAQQWVGRSRWNYGSFHLWGDVPALMPIAQGGVKVSTTNDFNMDWSNYGKPGYKGKGFNDEAIRRMKEGQKVPGFRFDGSGKSSQTAAVNGTKHGGDWFRDPDCPSRQGGQSKPKVVEGRKGAGAGAAWFDGNLCVKSSNSTARKAASAAIAKIPLPLARHIAAVYRPTHEASA